VPHDAPCRAISLDLRGGVVYASIISIPDGVKVGVTMKRQVIPVLAVVPVPVASVSGDMVHGAAGCKYGTGRYDA
jgi:hypothetical protein